MTLFFLAPSIITETAAKHFPNCLKLKTLVCPCMLLGVAYMVAEQKDCLVALSFISFHNKEAKMIPDHVTFRCQKWYRSNLHFALLLWSTNVTTTNIWIITPVAEKKQKDRVSERYSVAYKLKYFQTSKTWTSWIVWSKHFVGLSNVRTQLWWKAVLNLMLDEEGNKSKDMLHVQFKNWVMHFWKSVKTRQNHCGTQFHGFHIGILQTCISLGWFQTGQWASTAHNIPATLQISSQYHWYTAISAQKAATPDVTFYTLGIKAVLRPTMPIHTLAATLTKLTKDQTGLHSLHNHEHSSKWQSLPDIPG